MRSRRHQEHSVAILHHCSAGAVHPCRAEQPCGVCPLQSYGTQKELPAWLPQCFKPDFMLLAMKHRRGFCFTSVIAYNSMKLQPELISLAADKGSCQVWQHVITQGLEGGGCQPCAQWLWGALVGVLVLQGLQGHSWWWGRAMCALTKQKGLLP